MIVTNPALGVKISIVPEIVPLGIAKVVVTGKVFVAVLGSSLIIVTYPIGGVRTSTVPGIVPLGRTNVVVTGPVYVAALGKAPVIVR